MAGTRCQYLDSTATRAQCIGRYNRDCKRSVGDWAKLLRLINERLRCVFGQIFQIYAGWLLLPLLLQTKGVWKLWETDDP